LIELDLYRAGTVDWIPRKDRILLGALFLNQVNKLEVKEIKTIEQTSSNQQIYLKTVGVKDEN
jgi:hypothetical protein